MLTGLFMLAVSAFPLGGDSTRSEIWFLTQTKTVGSRVVAVTGDPKVNEIDGVGAVEFDGVDDGLTVQGCPLNGASSFTVEVVFKPYRAFPANVEQRFVHFQDRDRTSRRGLIELRLTDHNTWFLDTHIHADSSFMTLRAEKFEHPCDRWYHAALVYENGVGRHFINGVEEMSGTVAYIPVEDAQVSLGMRMNRIWYFKGAIRSVAMTRRALSADEFSLSIPTTISDSTLRLIASDDFNRGTDNWLSEFEDGPGSSLQARNGILEITSTAGGTVWLKQKMEGDVLITYDVTVVDSSGRADRVSDLNAFWMASDPDRDPPFGRNGKFSSYDDLNLYYAGVGGHDNTTTRFRKYSHDAGKPVLKEFLDPGHLLAGNRKYSVEIRVAAGTTTFSIDGNTFFEYEDKAPLKQGYFGFRTTRSRQRIEHFHVYQLAR